MLSTKWFVCKVSSVLCCVYTCRFDN